MENTFKMMHFLNASIQLSKRKPRLEEIYCDIVWANYMDWPMRHFYVLISKRTKPIYIYHEKLFRLGGLSQLLLFIYIKLRDC